MFVQLEPTLCEQYCLLFVAYLFNIPEIHQSGYTLYVFIDCTLCTDLISLYKPDVLFMYCIYKIIIIIICIFLSRLILCFAYCYVIDKYIQCIMYIDRTSKPILTYSMEQSPS
jgi:hypothetical protein